MDIKGFDLDSITSFEGLIKGYSSLGIQASNLSKATSVLEDILSDPTYTFTLAFSSTVGSSGLREIVAQFIRDAKPKVIITTAGAIEEDYMKSFSNFELGDFNMDDRELHQKGFNRIGNILVPNNAYVQLEERVRPLLEKAGNYLTPHDFINLLSDDIDDEYSFLKAARDVGAKVFCPAITDGALGIQLFLHKQRNPDFVMDVTGDMKVLANEILGAEKTGALVLGGGIAKHHTIGTHLMRGGLDNAVYITTAFEQDASLSGAQTREAVSWGKIKENADTVTVWGDYSIIFPLVALYFHNKSEN